MNRPKFYVYLPIVFALVLILGILIGSTFSTKNPNGAMAIDDNNQYSKIDQIIKYI